ncbi:CDPK-related protein kinase isoform X2 [Henckelia pumila]|uniref:CDPK-related protein kinase isoform X2 n=1 Tax=Henckelia pumila TaxID=405737 RepID=UPI003C6E72F1
MGTCASKPPPKPNPYARKASPPPETVSEPPTPLYTSKKTPLRGMFPPPSPAKHLKELFFRRDDMEAGYPEMDKNFGFTKQFSRKYEVGEVVGRGHFGNVHSSIVKKGELKGQKVAIKIIPKSKMTAATAIEDVRMEVKTLRALTGHPNIVKFYEAFEDVDNVYIVTELCEGGDLLERLLSRGGKHSEDQAKSVLVQILNAVAFYHLQGVVHRDLKPENFLFSSKDEDSELKVIDFGLSTFVKLDQKLDEIVGSAYYVGPEVLHRSYGREADLWSVGVLAYILLCGSRPFWARTESGIFREVLKASPSFDENPWPFLSSESKDFIKRLLDEDPRRRLTATQALRHPWIRNHSRVKIQFDIHVFCQMEAYMRTPPLRKAALRALSTTLAQEELLYLKEQFAFLCPDERRGISIENMRTALMTNATDAMKSSYVPDLLASLNVLQYSKMYFEEFCAAALTVHQMEAHENWEERARSGYDAFERNGNRAIVIEEVASELGISPSEPVYTVLQEWIRHTDGKLRFKGYIKLLHGPSTRRLQ